MSNQIHINKLSLKVPGVSRAQGRIIGEKVVQGLAKKLPKCTENIHLESLNIRLQMNNPDDATLSEFTDKVVNSIIEKVGLK